MLAEPNGSKRHCIHLTGVGDTTDKLDQMPIYRAFPSGIPYKSPYGDDLHVEPFPGDHHIQIERET